MLMQIRHFLRKLEGGQNDSDDDDDDKRAIEAKNQLILELFRDSAKARSLGLTFAGAQQVGGRLINFHRLQASFGRASVGFELGPRNLAQIGRCPSAGQSKNKNNLPTSEWNGHERGA